MSQSYQFSGLTRRSFKGLVVASVVFSVVVGIGVLLILLDRYIALVHIDWVMFAIIGATFISSIVMGGIFCISLSYALCKRWRIEINAFEIVISQQKKLRGDAFLLAQLARVVIFKTNIPFGFNQGVRFELGQQNVDIQIVVSPILLSSSRHDKVEFLNFLEYFYTQVLTPQFNLEQTNEGSFMDKIATVLTHHDRGIEYKYTFVR